MRRFATILPWLLAIGLIWPVFKPLVRPDDGGVAVLGQLPVLEGGRIKPLESVARAHLLIFHGKQSVRTDAGRVSAMEWLTEVLFNREAAKGMRVFRIDDPDIISMFGVEPGTKNQFSYRELEPYLARIQEQARLVDPDSKQRSPYERSIIRLFNNLIQYQMLTQTVYPLEIADRVPSYYQGLVSSLSQSPESMQPGGGMSPQMGMLRIHMRQLESMAQSPLFLVHGGEQWVTPGDWLRSSIPETGALAEPLRIIAEMAQARQSGDAESFREAGMRLASLTPDPADARPGMEFYFKQSQPFIVALGLYVLVALLVFLGWLFSPALFLGPAFGILLAGLGVHTFGLILRVFITGYAPVTNLYSSAVFTGWVAVVLSVFFERSQKQGIGSLAAAVVGFLSLLVAHHLSSSGDTMEKMRAVLNSNFWLTTHVITIIMGYGATFLAGFLGLIYIIYGWMRRGLSHDMQQSFHRMIFGAVCFSLLFSFIGTVLGGIWADQSWGRFWGWDPKENGALMLVLWTVLVIHALRCGMIRTRGLVNLAIGGNIITAWSWFGTNMLGVGLHSYGFMDSAFFWLVLFWISQLLFIAAEGLFPVRVRKA
jgi:ABC-type transport system involved in cytochrome c biogenesis permease subunit